MSTLKFSFKRRLANKFSKSLTSSEKGKKMRTATMKTRRRMRRTTLKPQLLKTTQSKPKKKVKPMCRKKERKRPTRLIKTGRQSQTRRLKPRHKCNLPSRVSQSRKNAVASQRATTSSKLAKRKSEDLK
jgi:neutral trehalase